jgi:hypothetical protein
MLRLAFFEAIERFAEQQRRGRDAAPNQPASS